MSGHGDHGADGALLVIDPTETWMPVRRVADDEDLLSEKESAVLAHSATGLTTSEVASRLNQSPLEAYQAITSATSKLGAGSKLEAVIIALRRGLINLPPD
jgi:DNA-binding CsgD family transcriptional regulator